MIKKKRGRPKKEVSQKFERPDDGDISIKFQIPQVESEVQYLRNLVSELTSKLLSYTSNPMFGMSGYNQSIPGTMQSLDPKSDVYNAALKKSEEIPALTDAEKKQKEEAPRQINQLLGNI